MDTTRPAWPLRLLKFPLTRILLSLLVAVLVIAVGLIVAALLHIPMLRGGSMSAPLPALVTESVEAFGAVAGLLVVGLWVERADLARLGFPRKGLYRQLGLGFAVGASLLVLVVLLMAAFGWYHPLGIAAKPSIASQFALEVALFLAVAVFEEVLFRGILFRIFDQWLGSYLALALTAFLFGLAHAANPGATWLSVVGITLEAGILLAGAFLLFRSLWVPIGLHWAWNLFEGPVLGTPVSGERLPHLLNASVRGPVLWTGGRFGPEAGLLCTVVGFAAGVGMVVAAHRRGQIHTPRWLRGLLRLQSPEAAPSRDSGA